MISVSIKACIAGRTKKLGFKKVPSLLYIIETDVQAAQFDAIVGNVNTGLSSVMHRHFTVSSAAARAFFSTDYKNRSAV